MMWCCLRGAGELLGEKQSGRMGLYVLTSADLITDGPLLDEARAAAAQILASNNGRIPTSLGDIMTALGLPSEDDSQLV